MHWDVSYKEAKHLGKYHGESVFKGLVTATNEVGEIRIQFHVVTDGHDQMLDSIQKFLQTVTEYNQAAPKILTTDNVPGDKPFLLSSFPSLQAQQDAFDNGIQQPHTATDPECVLDASRYALCTSVAEMNSKVQAARDVVNGLPKGQRVMSVDCEWDVHRHERTGMVMGSGMVAIIQLSYRLVADGDVHALVLQVHGKALPWAVKALFTDPNITFTGRNIAGDFARIGKDFKVKNPPVHVVDLGTMARQRDVVRSGVVSLEQLVKLTLGEKLSKAPAVRLSKWSQPKLTEEQCLYAALDAIKALEVYFHLQAMPDLTARLNADSAIPGLEVDVVPAHGSVANLATRAAVGTLQALAEWQPPSGMKPRKMQPTANRCLVQITKVLAPSLIVPGLKKDDGDRVTLRDFGNAPFCVMLPLSMVKGHVDSADVRVTDAPIVRPAMASVGDTDAAASADMRHLHAAAAPADNRDGDDDEDGLCAAGLTEDGDADDIADELDSDGIALVRAAAAAGASDGSSNAARTGGLFKKILLDRPPDFIRDRFSSVLGDAFHYMDRVKVPINHDSKKGYFFALQEAWFAWDPVKLEMVKGVLRKANMSEEEIEAKMYYNIDYFRERVPRVILPPSQLYRRVRAVYELYGNQIDRKTQAPLFNKKNWTRANNVLKEILAGHASDPPGFSFYTQRLDAKGDALVDAHGIPLIDCNRGTNDVECIHKQIVTTFGTWCTGVEMSDALMAERRHRYNHNVSARRRLGFPKIGHYDTWLIDSLQLLVERNHGVLLYPEWSNASDYVDTPESFGTVVLHSRELHTAIQDIKLDATPKSDPKRLSEDQQYLCKVMGTKLPLLPVVGAEECQLFSKLVLEMRDRASDMEAMSIEWCKHVNGVTVFPKLPVYLRTYHAKWQKHQRVRDAVRAAAQGAQKLKELNEQLVPTNLAAAVRFPEAMPPPPPDMEPEDVAIVAGIAIGGVPVRRDGERRQQGQRGKDSKQRRAKRCKLCRQNNQPSEEAEQCPGRVCQKLCYWAKPLHNPWPDDDDDDDD